MRYGESYGDGSAWGEGASVTVQTSTTPSFRQSREFKVRAFTNTLLRWGRWLVLLASASLLRG